MPEILFDGINSGSEARGRLPLKDREIFVLDRDAQLRDMTFAAHKAFDRKCIQDFVGDDDSTVTGRQFIEP